MQRNLVLATDSYKLSHWKMYPEGTEAVYSYFESRVGAKYPYTVFVGLQAILTEYMIGRVVTHADIDDAKVLATAHFGDGRLFNEAGWRHIVEDHEGRLPLRIKAVPEGSVIPTGNVLMTVENTCDRCFWLTNAMESLLTHVWYPSTVATQSRAVKETISRYLDRTAETRDALPFMLHDFGYRGASSHESAGIGGLGHLVNFKGTDTLPAMQVAMEYYGASLADLAFSVPATEHSVMTSLGEDGERAILERLLAEYPTGILSAVGDSYNIYRFVDMLGEFRDQVLARDGKVVVRPDSVTQTDPTPAREMVTLLRRLQEHFGSSQNSKGYDVLEPHVGLLWGDGIDPRGIGSILEETADAGYSAENMVFGMGGGLLQKINRDTQRFAFKSSAQKRNGRWHDVYKRPLDTTKSSKAGRLALIRGSVGYRTVKDGVHLKGSPYPDMLVTVFEDGQLVDPISFDEVRENAELSERLEFVH